MIKKGRYLFVSVLLLLGLHPAWSAQNRKLDSLQKVLAASREDTGRVTVLIELGREWSFITPDSGLFCCKSAFELSEKLGWVSGLSRSYLMMGWCYDVKGDYIKALETYNKSLELARQAGSKKLTSRSEER